MKKITKANLVILLVSVSILVNSFAKEKRVLKGNMTLKYNVLPRSAKTLEEIFTKGKFYGRLRVNTFKFDWDKEYPNKTKDNWAVGIGGSLIFKSAYFKGFGATFGLYTTQNPWHMDAKDVKFVKAGKDTFSRYKVITGDGFGMTVLSQAYIEYKRDETSLKIGRQIFESFLTKSNDTKMIPNTFEGYSLTTKYFPKTTIKAAYFTKQKLRDHKNFHDVITFGIDKNSNGVIDGSEEKWANNDDSAVHQGLSYINLKNAGKGTHNNLIVFEAANNSIDNLRLKANYTGVPELLHSLTGEIYYTIKRGDLKIIPGIRYMRQFDDGAGAIGGANLKCKTDGYKDPNSLDSWLFATRVDIKSSGLWKFRVGYSKIADKGDIVAPWRGFPTGGYTRAMGQYNWYANTKTYMVRFDYDFDKARIVSGLKGFIRYAVQDFDDKKPGVQADSNIVHIDLIEKFTSFPGLYAKLRLGFVAGDDNTIDINGNRKNDPSYNEYRLEINYLF